MRFDPPDVRLLLHVVEADSVRDPVHDQPVPLDSGPLPTSPELRDRVKIGVLAASVVSAIAGFLVLAVFRWERIRGTVLPQS